MNKNLTVILIVVALGLGALGLFMVLGKGTEIETHEVEQTEQVKPQSKVSEASLKNSTVLLQGTNISVTLKDGKATYQKGDDVQNITFVSIIGQTPTPDGVDIFASLADNMGGSGDFVYVGLFHVVNDRVTYTSSSDFLGDRILIESATPSKENSNKYSMLVKYLDRTSEEAMANTPTVFQEAVFEIVNHKIQ